MTAPTQPAPADGNVVVIADEITALGYALAGADVESPAVADAAAALGSARRRYEVVLITAAYARKIEPHALERALLATSPLTLVIPDARGEQSPPDLADRVRRRLGVER